MMCSSAGPFTRHPHRCRKFPMQFIPRWSPIRRHDRLFHTQSRPASFARASSLTWLYLLAFRLHIDSAPPPRVAAAAPILRQDSARPVPQRYLSCPLLRSSTIPRRAPVLRSSYYPSYQPSLPSFLCKVVFRQPRDCLQASQHLVKSVDGFAFSYGSTHTGNSTPLSCPST